MGLCDKLKVRPFHNGIHRTCFLAEPAARQSSVRAFPSRGLRHDANPFITGAHTACTTSCNVQEHTGIRQKKTYQ